MPIWLIRAGSRGEYEQKFIQENRVYVTWDRLDVSLVKLTERGNLVTEMTKRSGREAQGNIELGQPSVAVRTRDRSWRPSRTAA